MVNLSAKSDGGSKEKELPLGGKELIAYEYGSNESDFLIVKTKNKQMPMMPQRKSLRNSAKSGTIQGNAEALKQKHDDLSSKTPSFVVFNTIDTAQLSRIATISNLDLGDSMEDKEQISVPYWL